MKIVSVLMKINGVPLAEIMQEAVNKNEDSLQQAATITDVGNGIFSLCIEDKCTQVTQQNIDFFSELIHRYQEHYIEIVQRLVDTM